MRPSKRRASSRSAAVRWFLGPLRGALAVVLGVVAGPAASQSGAVPPAGPPAAEAPLAAPACTAESAILVDAATGTVLWEKNARKRRPMASTTKIMTGMLILESGRLDDSVAFSKRAIATPYANLNARPGEKISMRDLLFAVLLRSSNDGCVAAGEHLYGSPEALALAMTRRARELGAMDTNFVTTNGLYHPNHFSTAYDLAVMTRYAMRNPAFCEVVSTRERIIERSLNQKDRLVRNHNKLLSRYLGADGVKTGYVRQSGRCLVASSTRLEEGRPWRLIAVALNSSDTYGDTERLMDWGRLNFQPVFFAHRGQEITLASVRGGRDREVPLIAADDLVAVIRRDTGKNTEREIRLQGRIAAPVREAQEAGLLLGLIDGQPVGEVKLVAAHPVHQVWTAAVASWTGWSTVLLALLLGPRYARTIAKGARRRRRRRAPRRRDLDCEW